MPAPTHNQLAHQPFINARYQRLISKISRIKQSE